MIINVHADGRDTFHGTDVAGSHYAAHVSHVIILRITPLILFVWHLIFVIVATSLVVSTILRALILIEMATTCEAI